MAKQNIHFVKRGRIDIRNKVFSGGSMILNTPHRKYDIKPAVMMDAIKSHSIVQSGANTMLGGSLRRTSVAIPNNLNSQNILNRLDEIKTPNFVSTNKTNRNNIKLIL